MIKTRRLSYILNILPTNIIDIIDCWMILNFSSWSSQGLVESRRDFFLKIDVDNADILKNHWAELPTEYPTY